MEERTELRTSSCNTTGPTKRLVWWSLQQGFHLNTGFEEHSNHFFFLFNAGASFHFFRGSTQLWCHTFTVDRMYQQRWADILSYQGSERHQWKETNLYLTRKGLSTTLQISAGNSHSSLFRSLLVLEIISLMFHSAALWVEHTSQKGAFNIHGVSRVESGTPLGGCLSLPPHPLQFWHAAIPSSVHLYAIMIHYPESPVSFWRKC